MAIQSISSDDTYNLIKEGLRHQILGQKQLLIIWQILILRIIRNLMWFLKRI